MQCPKTTLVLVRMLQPGLCPLSLRTEVCYFPGIWRSSNSTHSKALSSSRSKHAEYFIRLKKKPLIYHWKWWNLEFDENWSLRLGAGWSQPKDERIVKFLKSSKSVSLSKYVIYQLCRHLNTAGTDIFFYVWGCFNLTCVNSGCFLARPGMDFVLARAEKTQALLLSVNSQPKESVFLDF